MERTPNRTAAPAAKGADSILLLKRILGLLLHNWYWFLISLAVTLGVGYLKIKRTVPVYSRSASILIKSNDRGGQDELLQEMGIAQTPANINNEILSFRTVKMTTEVVRRLHLEVDYLEDGTFYRKTIYGVTLPFTVTFFDYGDNETASMQVRLAADRTLTLSNMKRNAVDFGQQTITLTLGDTVETPMGRLAIVPSPFYIKNTESTLQVRRMSIGEAANRVSGRIGVDLRNKNSTILDIKYRDVSPARAEDVLNTLITVYNENWVRERNQKIISTNQFIKERLEVIEHELGDVDQDISQFKSSNLIVDVGQMGGMAVSQAQDAEQQSMNLNDQIYMVRYLQSYLQDPSHDKQLIPFVSGISNADIMNKVSEYNNVLLQRSNYLANSSAQNPLVGDLDRTLANLRSSILDMLASEVEMLQTRQRSLRLVQSQAESRVAANPQQAKYLLSVERQQKVKESLYLFLLQKREENELSQAFTAYNTQLIELPHGSNTPIEPVAKSVYLLALIIGLAVPAVALFLIELLKTTVQGRDDLKQLTVPFVGEIPLGEQSRRGLLKSRKSPAAGAQLMVREKSRDMVNETFRIVRTNIEFMLGFDSAHQVIMLTSFYPGSGKTFISANLSEVFAIKGKRVLAVDLDFRKGSLSEYVGSPQMGLSGYLSGQTDDFRSLIAQVGQIDVMPCGTLPPNPTELLFSSKFERMIQAVRQDYDYIIIDCPPVELVADASIIGRYADLTLFVVRAHHMERALVPEIQTWYDEKKFRNLAVILNGTEGYGSYGHYGYGRYGYGRYGYGRYGHYGYGKSKTEN